MQPIIAEERGATNPTALWIPKLAGEIMPGEHRMVQVTFHGRVEIRLCNDALALCFHDVCMEHIITPDGRRGDPPGLELFLTEKKAKPRMVDIHTQGTKLPWNEQTMRRLCGKQPCQFSQSLKGIVDVSNYKGFAVVKLPDTPPKTAEAVVFAFAALVAPKAEVKPIDSALAIKEIRELLNVSRNMHGGTRDPGAAASSPFVQQPQQTSGTGKKGEINRALSNPDNATENSDLRNLPRPYPEYAKLAVRAWKLLGLTEDKPIDQQQYEHVLDALGLFVFAPHAKRLFLAFDTAEKKYLDMSQFEGLLIANELLGTQLDLTLINVFSIFSNTVQQTCATTAKTVSWDGSQLNSRPGSAATSDASGTVDEGPLSTSRTGFRWPWSKRSQASSTVTTRQLNLARQHSRLLNHGTLDFSAFVEAFDTLGYDLPEGEILTAFKAVVQEKEEKLINYDEFKQLFMQLCDVEKELIQLGFIEEARRTETVAKTLLHRLIEENEKAYISEIAEAPARVAQLRHAIRQTRDVRRRQRAEYFDKRARQTAQRQAVQNQEKRLANKLQQEQRGRQREQNRQLRKQLMESQALNRQQQQMVLKAELQEKESKAAADARIKGFDRLNLSQQGLRMISRNLYIGREAQKRLAWLEVLDLSQNKLDMLPEDRFLYSMPMLRKLVLESNRLKKLPEEIESVPSLQILEVSNNQLSVLPDGLSRLSQLERLSAANNMMTSLIDLSNCPALEMVIMHSNQLESVEPGIGSLQRLQYLDLSNNLIHALPEELSNASSLTYLNIRGNRLGHLPQNFGQLQHLHFLDISVNSIAFLPKSCTNLTELELCFLERNNINNLAGTILQSANFLELFLPNNQVTALPPDIMNCTSLQHICLRKNELRTIAPEIGLLRQLQSLDVACNAIAELPVEFGSCLGLQQCDLSRNNIAGALPETIGLLSSLVDLNLSHNRISFIPENFGGLALLRTLDVSFNEIDTAGVPMSLTMLNALITVDLGHNNLTRFPVQLLDMSSIITLELGANFISLLPEGIAKLSSLSKLGLESNTIQILPPTFGVLLDHVAEIHLENNSWSGMPSKWGQSHNINRRSNGYSVSEVLRFTRAMHTIYHPANATWAKVGAECFSGRMGFDEFESAVRSQAPKWSGDSREALLFYFANANRHGIPPIWADDEEAIVRQEVARQDNIRKRTTAAANANRSMEQIDLSRRVTNFEALRNRMSRGVDDMVNSATARTRLHSIARQQALRTTVEKNIKDQDTRELLIAKTVAGQYATDLHDWSALATYEIEDNLNPTLSPLSLQLGVGKIGKNDHQRHHDHSKTSVENGS